jgi:hypothetical protein
MRVRNRRQLSGDESEQHESGNATAEHRNLSASRHPQGYAMLDPETMTWWADELSDSTAFAD